MRARSAILAVSVALAGCHTSFTPAEPDAGPPIDPLAAYLEARATEGCRRGIECEPDSSSWPQQLDCHPHYATGERTLERVRRGELRFDTDAAAECLRILRGGRGA